MSPVRVERAIPSGSSVQCFHTYVRLWSSCVAAIFLAGCVTLPEVERANVMITIPLHRFLRDNCLLRSVAMFKGG